MYSIYLGLILGPMFLLFGPWTDMSDVRSLRSLLSQSVSAVFPRLAHVIAVTHTLSVKTARGIGFQASICTTSLRTPRPNGMWGRDKPQTARLHHKGGWIDLNR
jgi:hypothetical protein